MIEPNTFHLISLGCAKNRVDSDSIIQLLKNDGYRETQNLLLANIIIINTCGFIDIARDESYQVLREIANTKREGQRLIAAGCLAQHHQHVIFEHVPELDAIVGPQRWQEIPRIIKTIKDKKFNSEYSPKPITALDGNLVSLPASEPVNLLRASVFGNSAYLKIADGCRRSCAFCSIPLIKGSMVSRSIDAILTDAQRLQAMGIREIILIAQDTTDYGRDLGLKNGLIVLLTKLTSAVPKVDWIRIMYAFPGYISDELIETIASSTQILPYIDVPLQHAHPDILKRMARPSNLELIYETIHKLRKRMPEVAIRTSFIVGYPGETEAIFQSLLDFVSDIRFDHVGAFRYSLEPGTASEKFGDPIPKEVKEDRYQRLMLLQQEISLDNNKSLLDKTLDVLIEGHDQNLSVGRSYRDAPEIDGLVLVEMECPIGDIVPVKITRAMPYDLLGTVLGD